MAYTFTVAIPSDMEITDDGGMMRLVFDKPDSLFEVVDQLKHLEIALLAGLGYGSVEITE